LSKRKTVTHVADAIPGINPSGQQSRPNLFLTDLDQHHIHRILVIRRQLELDYPA
jgi:hypothetical protein